MVQCFKVPKEYGSKVRFFLQENNWLDREYQIGKTGLRYLLFPLTENAKTRKILSEFKGTIESRHLQPVEKRGPKSLKHALKGSIPADKLEHLRRSFDVVGDIAVLEIPPELEKLEKSIAWQVKQMFKNIKVVAKKADITTGTFRIRQIKVLQGEKRTDTVYVESGLRMHVDLNKAYFSPRLGSERLRISKQVGKDENVLVMFAGVGPQALVIAKQNPSSLVWAVELNSDAYDMMKKNIRINYLGDQITPVLGDVRKKVPELKVKFDRIVMILPHEDEQFLPLALSKAKKGAKIHMYAISKEEEFGDLKKRLESEQKVKVKHILKAGEYSPRVFRICVEMAAP